MKRTVGAGTVYSPGRAKIEDVALATGVSIMTVSRAVRGVEGVSLAKRAEILRAATRLGYRPNSNARSLAAANSALVGISLPTLFDDVFAEILDGMRGTFISAGYDTIIDTTDYRGDREEVWLERMLAWRPAAVVLTGIHHSPVVRQRLRTSGIPTLEIWDHTPNPIGICVGIDHEAAGRTAGSYLVSLGYRRPAFVGVSEGRDIRAEQRLDGFRRAFLAADCDKVAVARVAMLSSFEAGMLGTRKLLEECRPPPDVIFYLNDHVAFGGMVECERRRLNVPGDIGIVGFNGLGINSVLQRRLTTVITPRKLMGAIGARNLLARVNRVRTDRSVALPVQLAPGETTRTAAQTRVTIGSGR